MDRSVRPIEYAIPINREAYYTSPIGIKYNLTEYWSRQIDKKNRIIYQVKEEEVTVIVVSAKGHYTDK